MRSSGSVKYEMRLLFKRCHGENPASGVAAESGDPCESVEFAFFIIKLFSIRFSRVNRSKQLVRQHAPTGQNLSNGPACHAGVVLGEERKTCAKDPELALF
jgi:hypothetical protein